MTAPTLPFLANPAMPKPAFTAHFPALLYRALHFSQSIPGHYPALPCPPALSPDLSLTCPTPALHCTLPCPLPCPSFFPALTFPARERGRTAACHVAGVRSGGRARLVTARYERARHIKPVTRNNTVGTGQTRLASIEITSRKNNISYSFR
jgi:hypothetical protein